MALYKLPNNVVRTFPIISKDAAGDVVPAPAGVVYTAVSSDPASIQAVIVDNTVVVNALVRAAADVSITVDDNGPLAAFTEIMDVVDDVAATSVALDEVNVTDVPQAVPAA